MGGFIFWVPHPAILWDCIKAFGIGFSKGKMRPRFLIFRGVFLATVFLKSTHAECSLGLKFGQSFFSLDLDKNVFQIDPHDQHAFTRDAFNFLCDNVTLNPISHCPGASVITDGGKTYVWNSITNETNLATIELVWDGTDDPQTGQISPPSPSPPSPSPPSPSPPSPSPPYGGYGRRRRFNNLESSVIRNDPLPFSLIYDIPPVFKNYFFTMCEEEEENYCDAAYNEWNICAKYGDPGTSGLNLAVMDFGGLLINNSVACVHFDQFLNNFHLDNTFHCCKNNYDLGKKFKGTCKNEGSMTHSILENHPDYRWRLYEKQDAKVINHAFFNKYSPANPNYRLGYEPLDGHPNNIPKNREDVNLCELVYNISSESQSFPYPWCNQDYCYASKEEKLQLTDCTKNLTLIDVPPTENAGQPKDLCKIGNQEVDGYHYMLDWPGHNSTHTPPDSNILDSSKYVYLYCAADDQNHTRLQFNETKDRVCDLAVERFNCCSKNDGSRGWVCSPQMCQHPNYECCYNDFPHGENDSKCILRTDMSEQNHIRAFSSDDTQNDSGLGTEWPKKGAFLYALWDLHSTNLTEECIDDSNYVGENGTKCEDISENLCNGTANVSCCTCGGGKTSYRLNKARWALFSDYQHYKDEGLTANFTLIGFDPTLPDLNYSPSDVCDLAYSTTFKDCFRWFGSTNVSMCTTHTYFETLNQTYSDQIFDYKMCTTPNYLLNGDIEVEFKRSTSVNPDYDYANERYPQNWDKMTLKYKKSGSAITNKVVAEGDICSYAIKEASYCYYENVNNLGPVLQCTSDPVSEKNGVCCFNDYKLSENCTGQDKDRAIECKSPDGNRYYKAIKGTGQFYTGARKDANIELECINEYREPLPNAHAGEATLDPRLRCAAYDENYPCCDNSMACHAKNADGSCPGGNVCPHEMTTEPPTPPPVRASRPSETTIIGIAVGSGVGGVLLISGIVYWVRTRQRRI